MAQIINDTLILSLTKKPHGTPQMKQRLRELESYRLDCVKDCDYDRAEQLDNEIHSIRTNLESSLRDAEKQRQDDEEVKLRGGFKEMLTQFEANWTAAFAEIEAKCEERNRILEGKHERERALLEEELEKQIGNASRKKSVYALQMRDTEQKLARIAHDYSQSREVKRRMDFIEGKDAEKWSAEMKASIERRFNQIDARQTEEFANLEQQNARMRMKAKRQKELEYSILQQKYKNLQTDMKHSHTLELKLKPEPEEVAAKFRPSHSQAAATYRGTQILSKYRNRELVIPSLCKVEEEQELRRSMSLDASFASSVASLPASPSLESSLAKTPSSFSVSFSQRPRSVAN